MKKDTGVVLKGVFISTLFFTYIFLLFKFPENSSKGVSDGLGLSFNVLIPTLFPFMVASGFLVNSGYIMRERRVFSYLSKKLFSLGNTAFPVLILSLLGGYPLGAKTVAELYKRGNLSKNEAKRLMFFAVNPSVSFVVSTVGYGMYRSISCGFIMLASVVLSALTLAVLGKFLKTKNNNENSYCLPETDLRLTEAFTLSVKESATSIIYMCAFVVLFSTVTELLSALQLKDYILVFLQCVVEVSVGAKVAFENFSMPHVCAVLSFGGISTAFQVMSFSNESGITFLSLIVSRLAAAFFSGIYCKILLEMFPVSTETFFGSNVEISTSPSYSLSVSICMVLMSVLFIMGDSIISKKNLTEKDSESKIRTE